MAGLIDGLIDGFIDSTHQLLNGHLQAPCRAPESQSQQRDPKVSLHVEQLRLPDASKMFQDVPRCSKSGTQMMRVTRFWSKLEKLWSWNILRRSFHPGSSIQVLWSQFLGFQKLVVTSTPPGITGIRIVHPNHRVVPIPLKPRISESRKKPGCPEAKLSRICSRRKPGRWANYSHCIHLATWLNCCGRHGCGNMAVQTWQMSLQVPHDPTWVGEHSEAKAKSLRSTKIVKASRAQTLEALGLDKIQSIAAWLLPRRAACIMVCLASK